MVVRETDRLYQEGGRVRPLTLILPVHPDNVEAWRRLCQEMIGTRRKQYETSRRQLGIVEERVSLLHAARGAIALISIDVEDREVFLTKLAGSTHPFDLWFKRQLREFCGIELTSSAIETHKEVLLEWRWRDHGNRES